MAGRRDVDQDPAARALSVELTAAGLARIAPDELVVLDETAAEYFANPDALLRPGSRDTPLGSGIDMVMLTPFLLAAASTILPLLGTIVGELAKGVAVDLAKEPLTVWVRRLIRRDPAEPPGPLALTPEQADRVRHAVVAQSYRIGLPSAQATLIADATVGSLHVRP
jgi:hypothetical protein